MPPNFGCCSRGKTRYIKSVFTKDEQETLIMRINFCFPEFMAALANFFE